MRQDRELFQKYLAHTNQHPMAISFSGAKDCTLWDENGRQYIDLLAGACVVNVGHGCPEVLQAIHDQTDRYLHVMVYGEAILSPQVQYADLLCRHLAPNLHRVYFTNSGAEAIEGAMKMAKRATGRPEIISCHHSYHGSTQGALSLLGQEDWRSNFRPLLPGIRQVHHNNLEDLQWITKQTAAVVVEPIRAGAGVVCSSQEWMKALRERCDAMGTLLIFDEIQTGFGRTGTLWGYQHFEVLPDVIVLAKALGGGLPLGAFISRYELMESLTHRPALGHITTYGGHPLSCAAGMAGLKVILEKKLAEKSLEKAGLFDQLLVHPLIKAKRSEGLLMAFEFENESIAGRILQLLLEAQPKGVFTEPFLFATHCLRITPALTISEMDIRESVQIILACCDRYLEEMKA